MCCTFVLHSCVSYLCYIRLPGGKQKMKLDISALLRGETRLIEFDYMLTPESVDNATFTDDAHVTGKVTDNGGDIRVCILMQAYRFMQSAQGAFLPYPISSDFQWI